MTDVDFSELMELHASKAYARKLSTFFDGVNHDSYQSSLQSALMRDPKKDDQYMLNRVLPELPTIKAFLEEIRKSEDDISSKAATMISGFTPDSIDFHATVYLVVGITGGGWTFDDEDDAFYVDIRSMKGDLEGMIYLSAHELYHLVQDRFFAQLPPESNVERLLSQTIKEGSASYVADFSKAESTGDYTQFNQDIHKVNSRRVQSNFDWFETVLFRLVNDDSADWDTIYQLGLTGQYDSPLYFVGYEMISTLDKHLGRKQLLMLLALPSREIFKRYIDQMDREDSEQTDLPTLGNTSRQIFASIDDEK